MNARIVIICFIINVCVGVYYSCFTEEKRFSRWLIKNDFSIRTNGFVKTNITVIIMYYNYEYCIFVNNKFFDNFSNAKGYIIGELQ